MLVVWNFFQFPLSTIRGAMGISLGGPLTETIAPSASPTTVISGLLIDGLPLIPLYVCSAKKEVIEDLRAFSL
jgi:hypothetical protein